MPTAPSGPCNNHCNGGLAIISGDLLQPLKIKRGDMESSLQTALDEIHKLLSRFENDPFASLKSQKSLLKTYLPERDLSLFHPGESWTEWEEDAVFKLREMGFQPGAIHAQFPTRSESSTRGKLSSTKPCFIGGKSDCDQMCIIRAPRCYPEKQSVHSISKLFQLKHNRDLIENSARSGKSGFVPINGNRVTVTFQRGVPSIEAIVPDPLVIDSVMRFASRQVLLDHRVKKMKKPVVNTPEVIISPANCAGQVMHIDCGRSDGNIQGAMILSPKASATQIWTAKGGMNIESAAGVTQMWRQGILVNCFKLKETAPLVSNTLEMALATNDSCQFLILNFGNLLLPTERLVEHKVPSECSVGTVLTLPGGVIHGGPHHEAERSVLFFTVCPSEARPYNTNVQYRSDTLMVEITLCVWSSIGDSDRECMLWHLAFYIYQCFREGQSVTGYLNESCGLRSFVQQVERLKYRDKGFPLKKLKGHIKKTAQQQ